MEICKVRSEAVVTTYDYRVRVLDWRVKRVAGRGEIVQLLR